MSEEKSYWKDLTLWDKTIQVELCQAQLQSDYDEVDQKLAHLLIEGVIFINNGWWYKKEGKPWIEDAMTFHVTCNDTFIYACADAEDILHSEIHELYEMWKLDKDLGPMCWCIKKRKEKPLQPWIEAIKKNGIWKLEELLNGEKK